VFSVCFIAVLWPAQFEHHYHPRRSSSSSSNAAVALEETRNDIVRQRVEINESESEVLLFTSFFVRALGNENDER